jgi:hypothetical protein
MAKLTNRKINLMAIVHGQRNSIGTFRIVTLAQNVFDKTVDNYKLVEKSICPACGGKVKMTSPLKCSNCGRENGFSYTGLLRKFRETGETIPHDNEMPSIWTQKGEVEALLEPMPLKDALNYSFAEDEEAKGLMAENESAAINLGKLLTASREGGYVMIVTVPDGSLELKALISLNQNYEVQIKSFIPLDLLTKPDKTVQFDPNLVSKEDVKESIEFVKEMKPATEDSLHTHDWRVDIMNKKHISVGTPTQIKSQVQDLSSILAAARMKAGDQKVVVPVVEKKPAEKPKKTITAVTTPPKKTAADEFADLLG